MFTTCAPYALVGAGATRIWLMQIAFTTRPLQLSLPGHLGRDPVVVILLGVPSSATVIRSPRASCAAAAAIFALIVRDPGLPGPGAVSVRRLTPPSLPHITTLPAPAGHPRVARSCIPARRGTGP